MTGPSLGQVVGSCRSRGLDRQTCAKFFGNRVPHLLDGHPLLLTGFQVKGDGLQYVLPGFIQAGALRSDAQLEADCRVCLFTAFDHDGHPDGAHRGWLASPLQAESLPVRTPIMHPKPEDQKGRSVVRLGGFMQRR